MTLTAPGRRKTQSMLEMKTRYPDFDSITTNITIETIDSSKDENFERIETLRLKTSNETKISKISNLKGTRRTVTRALKFEFSETNFESFVLLF